jgi:hypothetical protein
MLNAEFHQKSKIQHPKFTIRLLLAPIQNPKSKIKTPHDLLETHTPHGLRNFELAILNSEFYPTPERRRPRRHQPATSYSSYATAASPSSATAAPPQRLRRLPKSQIERSLNASPAIELQSNEKKMNTDSQFLTQIP